MANKPKMFIATESGNTEIEGVQVVFNKGRTRVEEGHPILEMHPDYFKPDEPEATLTVGDGLEPALVIQPAAATPSAPVADGVTVTAGGDGDDSQGTTEQGVGELVEIPDELPTDYNELKELATALEVEFAGNVRKDKLIEDIEAVRAQRVAATQA